MLKKIYHHIINYLLPKRCLSCSSLTQDANSFCGNCWKNLNFINSPFCKCCGREFALDLSEQQECLKCISHPPSFDKARALFKFDEHSKHIIHAFKYYDKTILAKSFAEMLSSRYSYDIAESDIIVPVPMHRFKRLFRMYNPAQILAQELHLAINLPIQMNVLVKTKWTKPQTTLSRKARLKNIAGSIKIENLSKIKGKKVILIDDVITTGTTVSLCSRLLKKAGAKEVVVLSIAAT